MNLGCENKVDMGLDGNITGQDNFHLLLKIRVTGGSKCPGNDVLGHMSPLKAEKGGKIMLTWMVRDLSPQILGQPEGKGHCLLNFVYSHVL